MTVLRLGLRRGRRGPLLILAAVAAGAALWISQLPAGALTVGSTPTPVTGNSTYFDGLGSPYGGCGLPQANLDSQDFVALNVFNTPGDYNQYQRPIPASNAGIIGMWDNGLNCGRYVQVTIGDFCTGVNDGAPNQPFCRNGSWVADGYNGATLTMLVADSCGDSNAWCRDDPYHLDLHKDSLNRFVLGGSPVGDMYPNHFNNRHISWQFVNAPNYSGDIQIGFLQGAQAYWGAIALSHLPNGLHGVDYFSGGTWQTAKMNGDMGQSYIISPVTAGGTQFQIRARDASDQPINGGRVYTFSLPSACGSQCSAPYTQATYTTSGGSTGSPTASPTSSPTTSPTASASPTRSASPSATPSHSGAPSSSPPATGKSCTATYTTASSWQGGFQGGVTVKNTGSVATTGWTVTLTLPGGVTITQDWSATWTSGPVFSNASYNGALSPGATAVFGFLANGSPTGVAVASCVAT